MTASDDRQRLEPGVVASRASAGPTLAPAPPPPEAVPVGARLWHHGCDDPIWSDRPVFLAGPNPVARFGCRPLIRLFGAGATSGLLLLLAAVVALAWANSPWSSGYLAMWETPISVGVGSNGASVTLHELINDGLMVVFFFVVGLEIKHELVAGHLRDRRQAVVPIVAAAGGMLGPALVYLAVAGGTPGEHGWGIPMATDIAFAVGVLAVLGQRLPSAARIFMLTLAVADDLGAILVIAVFYSNGVRGRWLLAAALCLVVVLLVRHLRVWALTVFVLLGGLAWYATLRSGVHPTVAGVVLGLLAPSVPLLDPGTVQDRIRGRLLERPVDCGEVTTLRVLLRESVPVADRLFALLNPVTGLIILPVFALANAGVPVMGQGLVEALSAKVSVAVVLGLVLGKTVGIGLATYACVWLRIGRLHADLAPRVVVGLGMIGGVGFTVALFVTGLAFPPGSALGDQARLGVLSGSVLAAVLGVGWLWWATRHREPAPRSGIETLVS